LLRKGAEEEATLRAIHAKVDQLNNGILPPGVKVVPMLDRSDLLRFTLHTVMRNLTEGMILVTVILFLFLLNARAALVVALTIPSPAFASICLNTSNIPANLLSLGALDFGMVVDGTVVMIENIVRHLSKPRNGSGVTSEDTSGRRSMALAPKSPATIIKDACHEVQRPVFYAIAIIITRTCRSSHCNAWKAACSGPWLDRRIRASRRLAIFDSDRAGPGKRFLP